MKHEIWIWKDAIDKDYFLIGVEVLGKHVALTGMFMDSIYDLFGYDFSKQCKGLTASRPTKLKVEISFDT